MVEQSDARNSHPTTERRLDANTIDAVRALARLSRLIETRLGDLSLAHYRVLSAVAGGDERASRIAERLALGKPTISSSVEALVRRGLLDRAGVEGDQRGSSLTLTTSGRELLAETENGLTEALSTLADRTPDPDGVIRALRLLGDAVEQVAQERAAVRRITAAPEGAR